MKLPALCLAAAFAGGAALGLFSALRTLAANRGWLVVALALMIVGLALAAILLRSNRIVAAGGVSLGCWVVLGVMAAWFASEPLPKDHVLSLLSDGHLDLSSPLRWHARLRDEPAIQPWGVGYELALESVESQGETLPLQGGLRLSYSPHGDESPLPEFHTSDEVAFLAQARLPQVFRDEGAFDRRAYLRQQGIDLTATLRSAALIEKEHQTRFTPARVLFQVRARLRRELNDLFPKAPQIAGVLRAMLLGDRSFVDRDESVSFQKTGVFHVLVVAGLHVGAFAVFLFWIGRRLRLPIGWTTLLLILTLSAYVAVIEQRPPVVRATLMAFVLLAGGFFFRRLELLNSAAIAALLILIVRPQELQDSSFQLSFLSIGCIAGIAVPWMERTVEPFLRGLRAWRDITRDPAHEPRVTQFRIDLRSIEAWLKTKLPHTGSTAAAALVLFLRAAFRVWELLLLTVVLQIGMAPLMALDFHRVTLLGALGNLVAVPLTGILVPLGFITLLFGMVLQFAGHLLANVLGFLTLVLIHTVEWFSQLPHGSYRIPGPPIWLSLAFFLLLVCIATSLRIGSRSRFILSGSLALLGAAVALVAIHPFAPRFNKGELELTVLDVGQGDSLLVVSPAGRTLLIDGGGQPPTYGSRESQRGPDPGEDAVSPYLWSRGIQKIDVVALTHAHQDHLGGLQAVLNNFRVGSLWIGREVQTPALAQLEAIAHANSVAIVHETRGQMFPWDGAEGEVLWPERDDGDPPAIAKNNDSLVFRLRFGKRTFLLPGDAEFQAESEILAENPEGALRADVLKIGHHGSKNSTTQEFLSAVRPQLAVISAGAENPYGHPSPQLLQRLADANVQVLRTDQTGAIHILTDGDRIKVYCFAACDKPASLPAEVQTKKVDPD
ncbi:MAG: DNA internalization-related competence protein ComEC/Rec2 [Candidatus Acidiferrum sp.]